MNRNRTAGATALVIYIAAIYLANWLVIHVGFITVWPTSLTAVAGVYMAGLTFPARDVVQRGLGRWAGFAAILAGAGLTFLISPVLAIASGVTFCVSEALDMTAYTWIAEGWGRFTGGVLISSTLAAVVDSMLFLYLAHIPWHVALAGQIVGKLEVVWAVGMPVAVLLRRKVLVPSAA